MKTFLLGIGCQRGGTSWLHNALSTHAHCAMSDPKELHVFHYAFRGVPGDPSTIQAQKLQRAAYAPVYDACAARFGADFIASIWRHWDAEGYGEWA